MQFTKTFPNGTRWNTGKILEYFFGQSALSDIATQYPIHLSKLPGNNIVVVATRSPEPGKALSGGMAPAVKQACGSFDHKFWYGYGETSDYGSLGRALMGAFNGYYGKSATLKAHEIEGFRVRKVKASQRSWELQYNEFCNRWVWPVCHNLASVAKAPVHWDSYGNRRANNVIAQRIMEDLGNDDTTPIWVHDYHHMVLGQALRQYGVENPIVYFHHIPLPTPETLEKTGEREKAGFIEMLESLRACDAVVFQTEEIAKRYLTLTGENVPNQIPAYSGVFIDNSDEGPSPRRQKQTYIAHAPISIDTQHEIEVARVPIAADDKDALELEAKLVADNIFINFERCDFSKGILQRVQAFEKLMIERPELKGKAQLVLGAEPTRSDIPEYKEYAKSVAEITERINANKELWIDGHPPIIFNNKRINHDSVVKLMRNRSEQRIIGLITSHEDGMNLTAKEFVAAQDLRNAGPLIISQYVGAASELIDNDQGAIGYESVLGDDVITGKSRSDNSQTTIENIARAMGHAINMPQEEANTRASFMMGKIKSNDIQRWAHYFADLMTQIKTGRLVDWAARTTTVPPKLSLVSNL